MNLEEFKLQEASIPQLPGVYRYYDENNRLLYVGKARNLHRRVSSYFNRDHDTARLRLMVRKIRRIEYTIVDSEMDALLLENSLIKEEQPFYNIRLKDDKTYPYLVITRETFPRLLVTRNRGLQGRYFGPYTSGRTMHILLQLIRKNFPVRTCTLNLQPNTIREGKFKTCLEYQIQNCLGPCEGLQSEEEYRLMMEKVTDILKGNAAEVVEQIRADMMQAAEALQFEKAEYLRQRYELLENHQARSTIVNPNIHQVDILSYSQVEERVAIHFMRVFRGVIIASHNFNFKTQLNETATDLLPTALTEAYRLFGEGGKEIISNETFEIEGSGIQVVIPRIGEKKKLLDLALKNGFISLSRDAKEHLKSLKDEKTRKLLETMQRDLSLKQLPRQIECFDNSNFHGDFAVSACVVFVDGKPAKNLYRHFNVKTVQGPNDFDTMREVITRRYKRQLEENQPLPDLIVVDGGKGQLGAAVDSLKALDLYGKVPILGIAKNLEELFYPNDPDPLLLDKRSITLRIIQQMRDEAHRFGITHHRDRRSKGTIKTALTEIPGLGAKSVEALLKRFRSLENIKQAPDAALEEVLGKARLAKLKAWLYQDINGESTPT